MSAVKTTWVGGCPFQPRPKPKAPARIGSCIVIDASAHAREYRAKYGDAHGRWSGMYAHFEPGKTLELVCDQHEAGTLATHAAKWVKRRKLGIRVTRVRKCEDGRGRVFLNEKGNAA